jgi:hypothetical protein
MRPHRHNFRRPIAALGLLAAAALLAGAWFSDGAGHGRSWAMAALLSPTFLLAAGMTLLSAVVLTVIAAAMWKAGASGRAADRADKSAEDGAALVEFALIFPIALLLVLLMIQGALLMAGNLCVHYSAFCAARTAATTVPLDFSTTEAPNVVDLAAPNASGKLRRIKLAAVYAVMPVSCGDEKINGANIALQDALEQYFQNIGQATPKWAKEMLARRWWYADTYTRVDLALPANKAPKFAPGEDLVVSVEHTFYLAVPYARRIFSVGADGVTLDLGGGVDYGTKIRSTCTLTNEGVQDWIDVERFP